ncbi:dihydrodipicolinate synthase family protein [Aminobacterium mobile]|uniref:dihydrodipicolinate synthase family protein n=1 Tax=Aminobacterium mobile TaxID=81467 RepID=UPI003314B6C4
MAGMEGIFAPIATAFGDDERIDLARFQENIEKFNATSLEGLVILGSNGEFVLLSQDEKVSLVAEARKRLSPHKKVIAGTGCESLRETIELTKRCADAGAGAVLIVSPSYYKSDMTFEALEKFFTAIADISPLPVMIYNMPRNTGVNIPSSLTVKLAYHPNITGIKDSSGNITQIAEVVAKAPENFSVFAGSGSFLLVTLMLGGVGGTLAVANVVPNYCVTIYNAWKAGEIEKARKLQLALLDLNAAVTSRFGIGGMKAAMDIAGFFGGSARAPILNASEGAKKEIRAIYEKTIAAYRAITGEEYLEIS